MVAEKEWTWLPLPTPSIWVPADNGKVIEHLSILHFLCSSLRIYEATLPPKIHFVVVVDKQAFPYLWISLVLLNLSIDNGSIVRPAGQWGTLSLIWCRKHFTCGNFVLENLFMVSKYCGCDHSPQNTNVKMNVTFHWPSFLYFSFLSSLV